MMEALQCVHRKISRKGQDEGMSLEALVNIASHDDPPHHLCCSTNLRQYNEAKLILL